MVVSKELWLSISKRSLLCLIPPALTVVFAQAPNWVLQPEVIPSPAFPPPSHPLALSFTRQGLVLTPFVEELPAEEFVADSTADMDELVSEDLSLETEFVETEFEPDLELALVATPAEELEPPDVSLDSAASSEIALSHAQRETDIERESFANQEALLEQLMTALDYGDGDRADALFAELKGLHIPATQGTVAENHDSRFAQEESNDFPVMTAARQNTAQTQPYVTMVYAHQYSDDGDCTQSDEIEEDCLGLID